MTKFCCYYEHRQNNKIILQRNIPIPFYHIWRVYNLEALRYLTKTNIEIPNYDSLYTKVYEFLEYLQTPYEVTNWVITPKKDRFYEKKIINKFNYKRKRILGGLASKISNADTNTIYKILEFQKQISSNNILMGPSQRSSKDDALFLVNLNYNKFLKLQLNNEKI